MGFEIRKVYSLVITDFKPVKEAIRKKKLESCSQAATYLYRAVRKRIRRSGAKSQVKTQEFRLYVPKKDGTLVEQRKSPTEWVRGKKIVAAGFGRGGRKPVEPVDQGTYRWNRVSKPGTGPISHPANQPGWQDEWLRNSIVWNADNGRILIVSNPAPPGKHVAKSGSRARFYPRTLELGGPISWDRKVQEGYVAVSIRHGTRVHRGGGKVLAGTKDPMGRKRYRHELKSKGGKVGRYVLADPKRNRSGRTQRSHVRRFKEPHVALTKKWLHWQGEKNLEPRPFMAPVQAAFFRDYFPQLFGNILEVQKK
ncbi:MAG: hypothetical protein Q4D38_12225 [Planctomycetia bacterium]|nr:hypothetical protein [Planctomycetia bacterium]